MSSFARRESGGEKSWGEGRGAGSEEGESSGRGGEGRGG